ncbi:putative membrane protein [Fulvivirga imtechensis AK7]|uniref:Putative membrane protein n=1 Tax=Fulvivirga imtechensis AK7 TaxID=1237149 RepID=L8JPN8_9BACT|nr:phage holin family protein [Fulvivirga imtechensis]ELR69332.1 putative membrane protein [Fulvivirga imtechensis AK7]
MNFLIKLLLSAIAVVITAYLLPGVDISGFLAAILVAAFLSFLNAIVRPVLVILTIPITIVTLGLFLLVINAIIILIADAIIPGFDVNGFWWALLFSIILAIVNSVFESLSKKERDRN